MTPSLSICIPSYRRAERLQETLEAFRAQCDPGRVEFCVAYNDDGPGTEAVLREFRARYPSVAWTTDPARRGIDRNIVAAAALARGEYIWFFGDDDLPEPDAVARVLARLREGHAFIVVNGSSRDETMSRVIEPARLRRDADEIYLPGDHGRLLADTASYATYLGGVVLERASWNAVDPSPYLDSDYVHVAVAYRAAVGRSSLVLARPAVRIRLGGAVWAPRYFQVELINWPGVVWGLPGESYPDAFKRAVCARKPVASLRRLLATRAYGYYGPAEFDRFVADDPHIPGWKKRASRAIAALPRGLARAALLAYRRAQTLWGDPNRALTAFRLEAGR